MCRPSWAASHLEGQEPSPHAWLWSRMCAEVPGARAVLAAVPLSLGPPALGHTHMHTHTRTLPHPRLALRQLPSVIHTGVG